MKVIKASDLPTGNINKLSSDALAAFGSKQFADFSTMALEALSSTQVGKLSAEVLNWLEDKGYVILNGIIETAPADTTRPVFLSATVNGNSLVMAYSDANSLSTTTAATSAFVVKNGGVVNAVTAVSVNATAKTVTLTLTNAVDIGNTVTVAYTEPTSRNDTHAIQDATGNDAVSLVAHAVTNLSDVMYGGTGNDKFVIHSIANQIDPTVVTIFIDNFKTAGIDTLAFDTGAATIYTPVVLPAAEVQTITFSGIAYKGDVIRLNNLADNSISYTVNGTYEDLNTIASNMADQINNAAGKLVTVTATGSVLTITADNPGTPLTTKSEIDTTSARLSVKVIESSTSATITVSGMPYKGDSLQTSFGSAFADEAKGYGGDLLYAINYEFSMSHSGAELADLPYRLNNSKNGSFIIATATTGSTLSSISPIQASVTWSNSTASETIDIAVLHENVLRVSASGNFIKSSTNSPDLSTILNNAKTAFTDTIVKYYVGSDGSNSYVITAGDTAGHYTDVIQLTGVSLSNVSATDFVA